MMGNVGEDQNEFGNGRNTMRTIIHGVRKAGKPGGNRATSTLRLVGEEGKLGPVELARTTPENPAPSGGFFH